MRSLAVLLALGTLACKKEPKDSGDAGWRPELACPDDPVADCDGDDDAPLEAAFTRRSVVPECFETWTDANADFEYHSGDGDVFLDCGCDRLCEDDDAYPGPDDGEGDGEFQATWIAGFQNARAASGVRTGGLLEGDGLWANVVVLRQGSSTLAIVGVDGFGWMHDEVLAIRAAVADAQIPVDHLIVNSSHSHASPDTVGMWGQGVTTGGFSDTYAEQVKQAIVDAVGEGYDGLRAAKLRVGKVDVSSYNAEKGVANVIGDTRDPWVIDPELQVMQFVDASTDENIGVMVHWANHPEASADEFTVMSADYVYGIRHTIENGAQWDAYTRPGLGGLSLYFEGALGGMMTPLHIACTTPDGVTYAEHGFEKADAIGITVGEMALDAVEQGEWVEDPKLAFRRQSLYLPVDNIGFQAMFLAKVIPRTVYNYDASQPIGAENSPEVLTEVDFVTLGPVSILTVPGELLPEAAIGGLDGSHIHAPGQKLISDDNVNPPDLASAPTGPALKERMPGTYRWIGGLSNDMVGYIVPEWEFETDPQNPYLVEAQGDHYEETNSLGPRTLGLLEAEADRLMTWEP